MDKLRLGVIGCGEAASSFVTAARFLPDWASIAAASWKFEETAAFAGKHGLEARTVERLCQADDIDVVAVATPPGVHTTDTLQALEGGKHVIVEKPFALSLEECDRMIEAAIKAKRLIMVGQTMRFFSAPMRIRELIVSGEFGRLVMIQDTSVYNYFGPKRTGWQLDPALSGGGVVMNPVIHLTDRFRYYADSEISSVKAVLGAAKEGFSIEGHLQAFYSFEKENISASLTLYGYGQTALDRTMVFLEKGVIQHDFIDHRITIYAGGNQVRVERPDPMPYGPGRINTGYVQELAEFAQSLRHGAPNRSDGYNGRANVAVSLAIFESAKTGQAVRPKHVFHREV